MQFLFQQLLRWQLRQVPGNTDSAVVQPQQLDVFIRFVCTEDQTEGRFFSGLHVVLL